VRNRHGRPLFRVKGFRARRVNPSFSNLVGTAAAVGIGLVATIGVGYIVDKFAADKSSAIQTGILVAAAAGASFLIDNPSIAAGVATGLLIVPLSKQIYSLCPSLAAPVPVVSPTSPALLNPPAPGAPVVQGSATVTSSPISSAGAAGVPSSATAPGGGAAPGLAALHMGNFQRRHNRNGKPKPWGMAALHGGMKGLRVGAHRGRRNLEALHMAGLQALHARGMGSTMARGHIRRGR
jgi:hypothetical protein